MRLRLAQLMYKDINLLILDEPTNHLDIDSCEVLEDALEEFNGTIIAVSHDRYFLNRLFDRIYWIEDQQIHGFEGNYQWAKEKMAEKRKKSEEITSKQPIKPSMVNMPKWVEEPNTILELEREIINLEAIISSIEKQMETSTDLEILQQLQWDKMEHEKKRNNIYEKLGALE